RCSATHNIKFFHNMNSFSQDYQKTIERTEIYYGPLTKQIKFLKLFSLLTSSGGLMVQPFLYLKAIENDNIGVVLGLFACIGFFAITTPLLIHMITKKYVTYLYYNAKEDIYIANTYSLFARTKKYTFMFHVIMNYMVKRNRHRAGRRKKAEIEALRRQGIPIVTKGYPGITILKNSGFQLQESPRPTHPPNRALDSEIPLIDLTNDNPTDIAPLSKSYP
ncbi:hypothetical protein ALC57_01113, partial [Trachymyrmex cornetzi]